MNPDETRQWAPTWTPTGKGWQLELAPVTVKMAVYDVLPREGAPYVELAADADGACHPGRIHSIKRRAT